MADIKYLTDHYDEKIEKIKSYNAPMNFVFITDQHNRLNEYTTTWNKEQTEFELATNAIESIQYILDRVPNIQCVVSGGDIGCDYNSDPKKIHAAHEEIMDALYKLSVPVHCCIGNHDDGLGPATDNKRDNTKTVILPDELHRLCMKNNPTDKNYYYVDFEDLGYRFVFLNCLDREYFIDEKTGQYANGWRIQISNEQAKWLENEALNTDLRIIVFNHTPLNNALTFGSEGAPEMIKPYDDLLNGPRIFHAIRSCKNVVAYIFGHVHYDNLFYDTGILNVSTQCSYAMPWCNSCPERKIGTITETAFDVFSIKGNDVYITRFGAGDDRVASIIK